MNPVDLARAYADALDREDDEGAARLLAEHVEIVFPHHTVRGRDAWLVMRAEQPRAGHIVERLEDVAVTATEDGAELRGTLVQRWRETGELAAEQPVLVSFSIVDGLIHRIELAPDA